MRSLSERPFSRASSSVCGLQDAARRVVSRPAACWGCTGMAWRAEGMASVARGARRDRWSSGVQARTAGEEVLEECAHATAQLLVDFVMGEVGGDFIEALPDC